MELWRDKWCFACHGLRRFARDPAGVWRCHCGQEARYTVARDLNTDEGTAPYRDPIQPQLEPCVLMISRAWCPACQIVRTVVRHVEADDLRCPRCEGRTEPAVGPDAHPARDPARK